MPAATRSFSNHHPGRPGALLAIGSNALAALAGGRRHLNREAISVSSPRVLRLNKEDVVELHLEGSAEIAMPLEYFSRLKLEQIVPEPTAVRVTDGGVNYLFEGNGKQSIRIHVRARDPGVVNATLRINQQSVPVRHLILP